MAREVIPLLSIPQLAMLRKVRDNKRGESGCVEFQCATRGEFSTIKALARRGLVNWSWRNSRFFIAAITRKGAEHVEAHSMLDGDT